MNTFIQIKDNLNDLDICLNSITKVVEEKTTMYPDFKTFVTIHFASTSETANLKGWTLEKWREFMRNAK